MGETWNCRSCGAAILWVKTESGRRMPLDFVPVEDGSIIVRMGQAMNQETAHIETKEETELRLQAKEPAARTAYVSHFVTCPDAAKWRKKTRKSDRIGKEIPRE